MSVYTFSETKLEPCKNKYEKDEIVLLTAF